MNLHAKTLLSGLYGRQAVSEYPCPMTHRQYERCDAERCRLTREGGSRALTADELNSLRIAQDGCVSYMRWLFGPDKPYSRSADAGPTAGVVKHSARRAGRMGKMLFRK